jgi:hypothetical protein
MAPSICSCVTAHRWWNTPQQRQAWAGSATEDVIIIVVVVVVAATTAAATTAAAAATAAARRNCFSDRHRGCSRGGDGRWSGDGR